MCEVRRDEDECESITKKPHVATQESPPVTPQGSEPTGLQQLTEFLTSELTSVGLASPTGQDATISPQTAHGRVSSSSSFLISPSPCRSTSHCCSLLRRSCWPWAG